MPAGGFKKGGGRTRTEKRTALEQGGELAGRQENGISVDPTPPHPGELNTPPQSDNFPTFPVSQHSLQLPLGWVPPNMV